MREFPCTFFFRCSFRSVHISCLGVTWQALGDYYERQEWTQTRVRAPIHIRFRSRQLHFFSFFHSEITIADQLYWFAMLFAVRVSISNRIMIPCIKINKSIINCVISLSIFVQCKNTCNSRQLTWHVRAPWRFHSKLHVLVSVLLPTM